MIKKKGVKYTIEYYRLIPYSMALILIIILQNATFSIISILQDYYRGNVSIIYELVKIGIAIAVYGGWGFFFTLNCMQKAYFYRTGRSYRYDRGHYQRTFGELVDYFKNAEPHKLNTDNFPVADWRSTKGLIFGTDKKGRLISIPSSSECNISVFGPPGSGKTSGIAIINACRFQGSVLAVDIKGDLYNYVSKHTKRKIIRFAPDAKNAMQISCHFDPFDGLKKMELTDQKLYLESMATILIPDEGGNEGNYFSTRARKLFQGIAFLILSENPNTGFPDVVHQILQGNVFDWVKKAIRSDCEPAKELLSSFYGNNEKNVSGAYDALTTALVHFSNPILDELLSKNGPSVSIRDLESGTDVYLQIKQEHLDAYAPLFTLLIQSFSMAFTRRPDSSTGVKNRPILMLLDEFPQLTFSYQMINSSLSTLRSKSVIVIIIQQNLSQLEYRYQPAGVRSIIGNCNYQIILGSNDINSSKIFSDTFGVKKVLKVSNSISHAKSVTTGRSVQETTEKVFPPEVFGDLPAEKKLILYCKGKYAELIKLNCYQD
ncbi:type IV secretory system conjugative DNA transfer family protein [Bilifractor sp. LCP19S3_H10]|uniref:type IV secretory system conjugative DNA transfer family protein n=1 Tax=Bilifractor sp. LCP19S3_H10 TaxID=3438736 RepID=UPI003F8F739A